MRESADIAIIGMGKWGNHLLENILKVNGLEVRYICARQAEDVELKTPASIIHDENIILKDKRIKGVVIATQPQKHFASASKFLRRGLKIFVEKPLTLSYRECSHLAALAARKTSAGIMVGNKFIYSPAIRALKSFLIKHDIKIESISSRWLKGCAAQKAGIFFDICYHHIYLFDYLLGMRFDRLEKFATNEKGGIASSGIVILKHGRLVSSIEATYNNHFDFFDHSIRLETDKGVFIVKEKDRKVSVYLDNKGISSLTFKHEEDRERCVEEEMEAYYRWLIGEEIPEFGPDIDCRIIRSLSKR